MIYKIPVNYSRLGFASQTSSFSISGSFYDVTVRKSITNNMCFITINKNGNILVENRTCTAREWLLSGLVNTDEIPENFQFVYTSSNYGRDFIFEELGKTLFLFFWDGDIGDFE